MTTAQEIVDAMNRQKRRLARARIELNSHYQPDGGKMDKTLNALEIAVTRMALQADNADPEKPVSAPTQRRAFRVMRAVNNGVNEATLVDIGAPSSMTAAAAVVGLFEKAIDLPWKLLKNRRSERNDPPSA